MTSLADALGERRIFVEFPSALRDSWMGVCEVLLQERFRAIALPLDMTDLLGEIRSMLGRRATIGVWGVLTTDDVRRAVDAGAAFVTSPIGELSLVAAAGDVPVVLGALTPTEIQAAARAGAGVQITPVEAVGVSFATGIHRLLPDLDLIATGRLSPPEVGVLLQDGVKRVGLSPLAAFSESGYVDSDLGALRTRLQGFAHLL